MTLMPDRHGISFKSLQESLDTTTSGGKLVFHVFAALAEFERDLIRERTQAGLAAARARGRQGGGRKGGGGGRGGAGAPGGPGGGAGTRPAGGTAKRKRRGKAGSGHCAIAGQEPPHQRHLQDAQH